MTRPKLTTLAWWDILILTFILFGEPIYQSTLTFLSPSGIDTSLTSSQMDWSNYRSIIIQGSCLFVALAYLLFRRFDITNWQFKPSWRTIAASIGLFLVLVGLTDLFFLLFSRDYFSYFIHAPINLSKTFGKLFQPLHLSSVLYALLNGYYEEIYFIGMCLSVKKNQRVWFWLVSLIVRFSFHTYQGLLSATAIALVLGTVYYMWYEHFNHKNLLPIVLSHALADIWGLGVLFYIFD